MKYPLENLTITLMPVPVPYSILIMMAWLTETEYVYRWLLPYPIFVYCIYDARTVILQPVESGCWTWTANRNNSSGYLWESLRSHSQLNKPYFTALRFQPRPETQWISVLHLFFSFSLLFMFIFALADAVGHDCELWRDWVSVLVWQTFVTTFNRDEYVAQDHPSRSW